MRQSEDLNALMTVKMNVSELRKKQNNKKMLQQFLFGTNSQYFDGFLLLTNEHFYHRNILSHTTCVTQVNFYFLRNIAENNLFINEPSATYLSNVQICEEGIYE